MTRSSFPVVQLLHRLPDGSAHVDLLLATAPSRHRDERTLETFRLPRRADRLAPGSAMDAVALDPHRAAYLDHEGPVSGGRGRVDRLTRGTGVTLERDDRRWALTVRWSDDGPACRIVLERHDDGWRLSAEA